MDTAAITGLAPEPWAAEFHLLVVSPCLRRDSPPHPTDVLEFDWIELHIPAWDEGHLDAALEFKLDWLDPAWSWTPPLISLVWSPLGKL